MLISDWSSDVCSSDLEDASGQPAGGWMPEQRVRLEAALDAFTRTAAYAAFAEKRFGSLAPGQRADFLLIDRDISTSSPAEIRGTQVLETWIGGKRSEEHTSELQSLMRISYAVFCLKKKKQKHQ